MTSTIMLFYSILILVSVYHSRVEALIGVQMPRLVEPSKTICSQLFLSTTNGDDSSSADDISSSVQDRREFLSLGANRMWVLGGGVAATAFAAVPPSSVEASDPFAELDDIAAKIKLENSNYPNSISPLPTYKTTERELISDDDIANIGATQNAADRPKSASDLDKALQNMKKQKQIDPRTHG